jgi:cytochrome P450
MDIKQTTYPYARHCPFDMPSEFAWIRENQPVTEVTLASGDSAWLVSRYDDVRAALANQRFSRGINQPGSARLDTGHSVDKSSPVFNFGGTISEPPGHTRWRRMVNRAFTQRQADAMREQIAHHTEAVLDEMTARGAKADLMTDFAYELPIRIICELLGIPDDNREEFTALAERITRRDMSSSFMEFGEALSGIGRYALGLISRKRKNLGPDLLSSLIRLRDDDDSGLTNEELVSTVILLLMAGYESTAVQFGNAIFALFRNPDQLKMLMESPTLIENAVEELLRYAQMGTGFAVAKSATEDIEISGTTIPKGATVFLSIGSADRDSAIFGSDAEFLDLTRKTANRQVAFSAGPHFCLGAALARAELQEGLGRLLSRFPAMAYAGDLDNVPLTSNLFTFYPRELPVTLMPHPTDPS